MTEQESLVEFLGLFFDELVPPGFIEVRLIHEKGTDSSYTKVHWFPSIPELAVELDALNAEAEQHQAAVFFGVLPRPRVGAGRKRDLTTGRVVWADLDFDQYEGGEEEARALLYSFPIPPSAVVRSGHGLHAYWALDEARSPDECSRLAKRVELALRSDHVSDAPRIMRLPFTFNRKHGEASLVELERLHAEDSCDPGDLEACTPEPPVRAPQAAAAAPDGVTRAAPPVEAKLPDAVAALFKESRTLVELYAGRGKQKGDQSTSGYDMSFAVACVKKGITDPELLAQAIASRPNTRANEKGPNYIRDTVAKALESRPARQARPEATGPVQRAGEGGGQPALFAVDFTVERVVIYDSDPPVYDFHIDGKVMRVSSQQLQRSSAFELRFLEIFRRLVKLPSAKERAAWRDLVNSWLADAEHVEQPPEASRDFQLREAIEDFIADMQVGSEPQDLDRDRALLTPDGRKAFKTKTLMKALRANFRDIGSHTVSAVLRGMGLTYSRPRFDGTQVRTWVCPEPSTNGKHAPEGEADDEEAPF